MASDSFIGVLTGLAGAHSARQKNIFDQEVERNEQIAKLYEKVAEHPAITPEGREDYIRKAFSVRMLKPGEKLPKDVLNFATEVAPKFGQSWMGGQTSHPVEATNMPIPADLEGGLTLPQIQQGAVPPAGGGVQAMQTPPPSQYEVPTPQPPPGAQRSAFYSPQELSKQKMTAAAEMLQALGPIQRQLAMEKKRGELTIEPPKVGEYNPEAGLYKIDPATGQIDFIREPQFKPVAAPQPQAPMSPERLVQEEALIKARAASRPAPQGASGSFQPGYTDKRGVVQTWVNPTTKEVVHAKDLGLNDELFRGPMGMDRQTREQAAASGLRAIARFRQELTKNPNMLTQLAIPGSPGARIARAARNEIVDVLTRIRTGAALNENEEKFYSEQAPGLLDALLDEPEAIEYKLGIFEDQFKQLAPPSDKSPTPPPSAGGEPSEQQIQAEMKANPAYSRQEIIDALKAAGVR